jgi:hypothetical protein
MLYSLTPFNPLATTTVLSTSMGLHILDISYKWNHTIYDFKNYIILSEYKN